MVGASLAIVLGPMADMARPDGDRQLHARVPGPGGRYLAVGAQGGAGTGRYHCSARSPGHDRQRNGVRRSHNGTDPKGGEANTHQTPS